MNKTLMSIVLFLGFALLVGLSVASYAAESVGNVVDDTVITTTVKQLCFPKGADFDFCF